MVSSHAPIARLKKRPDFLAAAKGANCARGAVVAQARHRGDASPLIRIGFTATRRIGGAVVRNRAKRRLREAARLIAPFMRWPAATMYSSPGAGRRRDPGRHCLTI